MGRLAGLILLVGVALASGCDVGDVGRSDGEDSGAEPGERPPPEPDGDGPGGDGPVPGATSLWLEVATSQPVPGVLRGVGPAVVVDSVRVVLGDVRAVGDAAPGDERTTFESLELVWDDDGAPPARRFEMPPVGVYSRVVARVRAVEIQGEVALDGGDGDESGEDEIEFTLELEPASQSVDIDLESLDVAAGVATTIAVEFAVAEVVGAVDWSQAERRGNRDSLSIDGDEQPGITAALEAAFRLAP